MRRGEVLLCGIMLCTGPSLFMMRSREDTFGAAPWEMRPQGLTRSAVSPRSWCRDELPASTASGTTCLDQALWGKCAQRFLRGYCNRSCGRCASAGVVQRRVLLVSARQPGGCASSDQGDNFADLWVMRAMQNKAALGRGDRTLHPGIPEPCVAYPVPRHILPSSTQAVRAQLQIEVGLWSRRLAMPSPASLRAHCSA